MIRKWVSAAFLMRDGFTGAALTGGAATSCLLDGRPLTRPIWKKDGYLVLTDLAPGRHVLSIRRHGYREEQVTIDAAEDFTVEDTISLKPGAGYRFPPETARVSLSLSRKEDTDGKEPLWLGVRPRTRLRVAQEKLERGSCEAHLFCEGKAALLPIPGHFLLADGKAPELIYLRFLHDEAGTFASPPEFDHSRGTELIPMQSYTPDENGCVQVLLREPGTLIGFCAGSILEAETISGAQNIEWKLEV